MDRPLGTASRYLVWLHLKDHYKVQLHSHLFLALSSAAVKLQSCLSLIVCKMVKFPALLLFLLLLLLPALAYI